MKREDKIEQLENLKCHCYDMARVENSSNEWMKDIEALDFAIATLKQQPSEDCISRQAVIEYIKDCDAELMHDIENESVREDILNMPPVTPTHGTCEDCVSRADVMTEIQLNAKRYTLAKECESLGQVVWSDNLISINDVLDVIRALPPVTPKQESIQGQ